MDSNLSNVVSFKNTYLFTKNLKIKNPLWLMLAKAGNSWRGQAFASS
jgi:hypothetical protein